jgi:hypothetical protein
MKHILGIMVLFCIIVSNAHAGFSLKNLIKRPPNSQVPRSKPITKADVRKFDEESRKAARDAEQMRRNMAQDRTKEVNLANPKTRANIDAALSSADQHRKK